MRLPEEKGEDLAVVGRFLVIVGRFLVRNAAGQPLMFFQREGADRVFSPPLVFIYLLIRWI